MKWSTLVLFARFKAHVSALREENPQACLVGRRRFNTQVGKAGGPFGPRSGGGERSAKAKTSGAIGALSQGQSLRLCSTFSSIGLTGFLWRKGDKPVVVGFFGRARVHSSDDWQAALEQEQ